MRISFIIPAYNEEKYIERCLSSLFSQEDMGDCEVIVVDNNSTDNTRETVERAFPAAKIVSEKEQGMTKARNRGAKEAKGALLVFFDADVIVPQGWLKKVRMLFESRPSLLGVSGPYRFYDLPLRYKIIEFIDFRILYALANLFFHRLLKKSALWVGGNIAVRRHAFEDVGGFNPSIVFYGEDVDLPQKLLRRGPIAFSRDIWVWSSARRLLKGGPFKEGFRYFSHYVRFFFFNRSHTKSYSSVR